MMKRSRAWAVLALTQPALWLLLWSLLSAQVRFATWCHVGLWHLGQRGYPTFASVIRLNVLFIALIAIPFIVDALRNKRLTYGMRAWWATALVIVNPLITPAYWLIHLRRS